jgi:glycosyltransferase involved in cell wall biosynthesis
MKGLVKKDDIVLTDGFWGLGLEEFQNVVSVAHGNWSHTTKSDVDAGIQPDFPYHHHQQLEYRTRHLARGGRIVAVSDFIADQCKFQWNFDIPVINNGIETSKFVPRYEYLPRKRPLVIHGVTNSNKGFDHITALKRELKADVVLLDDAGDHFGGIPKYQALAQADLVAIPSAHEGFGYFCLESLSVGVPVVAYAVGLPYLYAKNNGCVDTGPYVIGDPGIVVAERYRRDPAEFVKAAKVALIADPSFFSPRSFAENFSIERFRREWRGYVNKEFGYNVEK